MGKEKHRVMDVEEYERLMKDPPFKSVTMKLIWKVGQIFIRPYAFLWAKWRLKEISKVHEELSETGRVDIFPSESGKRGFVLILDRKRAFYFYQDGDHFFYDGCEVGEYEKGEVTIFDGAAK